MYYNHQLILYDINDDKINVSLILDKGETDKTEYELLEKVLRDLRSTKILCTEQGVLYLEGNDYKRYSDKVEDRLYINMSNILKWEII